MVVVIRMDTDSHSWEECIGDFPQCFSRMMRMTKGKKCSLISSHTHENTTRLIFFLYHKWEIRIVLSLCEAPDCVALPKVQSIEPHLSKPVLMHKSTLILTKGCFSPSDTDFQLRSIFNRFGISKSSILTLIATHIDKFAHQQSYVCNILSAHNLSSLWRSCGGLLHHWSRWCWFRCLHTGSHLECTNPW